MLLYFLPNNIIENSVLYSEEKNGYSELYIKYNFWNDVIHCITEKGKKIDQITFYELYLNEFIFVGVWSNNGEGMSFDNYIKQVNSNIENKKDKIYFTIDLKSEEGIKCKKY